MLYYFKVYLPIRVENNVITYDLVKDSMQEANYVSHINNDHFWNEEYCNDPKIDFCLCCGTVLWRDVI